MMIPIHHRHYRLIHGEMECVFTYYKNKIKNGHLFKFLLNISNSNDFFNITKSII